MACCAGTSGRPGNRSTDVASRHGRPGHANREGPRPLAGRTRIAGGRPRREQPMFRRDRANDSRACARGRASRPGCRPASLLCDAAARIRSDADGALWPVRRMPGGAGAVSSVRAGQGQELQSAADARWQARLSRLLEPHRRAKHGEHRRTSPGHGWLRWQEPDRGPADGKDSLPAVGGGEGAGALRHLHQSSAALFSRRAAKAGVSEPAPIASSRPPAMCSS